MLVAVIVVLKPKLLVTGAFVAMVNERVMATTADGLTAWLL